MMYHPMHLHGHFFRVLNKHGEYSPLKHTVIVAPMDTTTIEFKASEVGDWFFHCHLLYHMMSGMARMVHYDGFTPAPDVMQSHLRHNPYYYMGDIAAMSNMTQGHFSLSNERNIFTTEWEFGWANVDSAQWQITPTYDYSINRFLSAFIGSNLEREDGDMTAEDGIAGFRFLLPLSIESSHWLDTDLQYRLTLHKAFDITPRLSFYGEGEFDTAEKWEIRSGMMYSLSRDLSIVTQWHSDFSWGGGINYLF
ncbi:MAG: multicopper oxidase domain-containing protein, partial [Bdellovibrionales bacterium]|nr:multicopper oxidase domain-containing protein [Bdellovibrionales bacterium]